MDTAFDFVRVRNNSLRGRGRGVPNQGHGGQRSYGGRMIVDPRIRRLSRGSLRVNSGPSAIAITKSFRRTKNFPWKQDLFEDSLAASGLTEYDNGTKLHVSNLDHGVSNDDIRELFAEIGELKRYAIHYDKNGKPSGSAEVVYTKRSDAFAAMKRYNNVRLDGRPIKIEIVSSSGVPVSARINVIGGVNGAPARRVAPVSTRINWNRGVNGAPAKRVFTEQGGARPMTMAPVNRGFIQRAQGMRNNMRRDRGWNQAQGRSAGLNQFRGVSRGGGRGHGKKQQPKEKSAEELDKELEKYHAEAMELS